MPPSLQLVGSPNGSEHILARLQAQVVGVVEAEPAAGLLQLLGSQALQRSLRRHGHEHGQLHGAVGQRQNRGPGPGCLGEGCPSEVRDYHFEKKRKKREGAGWVS